MCLFNSKPVLKFEEFETLIESFWILTAEVGSHKYIVSVVLTKGEGSVGFESKRVTSNPVFESYLD